MRRIWMIAPFVILPSACDASNGDGNLQSPLDPSSSATTAETAAPATADSGTPLQAPGTSEPQVDPTAEAPIDLTPTPPPSLPGVAGAPANDVNPDPSSGFGGSGGGVNETPSPDDVPPSGGADGGVAPEPPADLPDAGPPEPAEPFCDIPPTLREAGDCTGRLVGVALKADYLSEAAYVEAAREHSYVTAENEMKWESVQPSRGQFTFGPADRIVDFALQNDMLVKGHALVWHSQLAAWVSDLTSEDAVRTAMVDHIEAVMDHFRGDVVAWDVVNEAWAEETTWQDGVPAMRDSVFHRYLGPSFIDEAFEAAHQADPDAKLYYNDYDAEGLTAKADAIYEMVASMVERGVPIDGVGLQMHMGGVNDLFPLPDIAANMQRFADLGLEVLLSEMDVRVCRGQTPEEQKQEFHDLVALCVALPACPAVTFWGVTDRYSWLNERTITGCEDRAPAPLMWDDDYRKKPAYDGVMEALTGR